MHPEPTDRDRTWDIEEEDNLGLSSRYMTNFVLVNSQNQPVPLEDLHTPSVLRCAKLRRQKVFCIGQVYKNDRMKMIKTSALVAWNVEMGDKPSSGVWIATSAAWYKLLRPHASYQKIYQPLSDQSRLCILMASILKQNGDVELSAMKEHLKPFAVSRHLLDAAPAFSLYVLQQVYSPHCRLLQQLAAAI